MARQRFGEKQGESTLVRLLGSRRSWLFQFGAILLLIGVVVGGPALWDIAHSLEYNPQDVGGRECQGVATETSYTINGVAYSGHTMSNDDRMTDGRLLLRESGLRGGTDTVDLPAGDYTLAFRVNGLENQGSFEIALRDANGELIQTFTQEMKHTRWYARAFEDIQLNAGQYEIKVTPPGVMRWCMEIAHQER